MAEIVKIQKKKGSQNQLLVRKSDLIAKFLQDEKMTNAEAAATFFVADTSPARWAKGEVEPTGTAASLLWTLGVLNEITRDWDRSEEMFVQRLEQNISEGLISVEALDSALKVYALLKGKLKNKKWISKVIIQHEHEKEREKLLGEIEALKRKLDEREQRQRKKLQAVDQEDDETDSDDE
jgi:hypothetical protein